MEGEHLTRPSGDTPSEGRGAIQTSSQRHHVGLKLEDKPTRLQLWIG